MSVAQSIRGSVQWVLAGNLGSQALNFAFGVILARLLLPEDFGLLVTVQIFTGIAGLIASGGMGQALVRSKDADQHDFNLVFTMQFVICVLIFAFFFFIAPYFARWYDEPIYAALLRVTAINFLLRPLVSNHSIWLHRNMRFKVRAIIGVISGLLTSMTSVYMAWNGMGVWSLAFSGLLGSFVNWYLLSRQTPLQLAFAFDVERANRLGGTGIKFAALDIVDYLRGQVNNFVIGRLANPAAVGLFNKADSLSKLPYATISASVYQPVFRALSAEQDNPDKSKYLFLKTVTLLLIYTLPAYIVLSWLAEPLITFVYGPKWTGAAAPMSVLAWALAFSSFANPAGALLAAQNRLSQELWVQIISLLLNGVACIIGMRWGLTGAAWGVLLVRFYTNIHFAWLVSQCIQVNGRDILRVIRPGTVVSGATLGGLFLASILCAQLSIERSGPMFLGISLLIAGTCLLGVFIFSSLEEIAGESARWRHALRRKR